MAANPGERLVAYCPAPDALILVIRLSLRPLICVKACPIVPNVKFTMISAVTPCRTVGTKLEVMENYLVTCLRKVWSCAMGDKRTSMKIAQGSVMKLLLIASFFSIQSLGMLSSLLRNVVPPAAVAFAEMEDPLSFFFFFCEDLWLRPFW